MSNKDEIIDNMHMKGFYEQISVITDAHGKQMYSVKWVRIHDGKDGPVVTSTDTTEAYQQSALKALLMD